MCGIAGFAGRGSREDLVRMTERIAHRGPDAAGFHCDEAQGIFLGHRRLSIVDLAGGGQPMSVPDRSVTVVFNGEIYNQAELRRELEAAGRVFQTDHSDTEVLLHAYLEWGPAMVDRLNGMWAFALWDERRKKLFLSRDRFGKKPLYWFAKPGVFAFGSELTALLAHPDCPRSLSRKALQKFYAYALIPAPHSVVEGVWKLPGGHTLEVGEDLVPVVKRVWRYEIEPDESRRDEGELKEELRDLLDKAVRRRLMSDVPLGVFLSGGIDSTLVAALAARALGEGDRLHTFSIGFNEASFDESAFSQRAAEYLGTRHASEILDLDRAVEVLPEIFDKLDEPQGDNSLLPTWLLCRFTRRHVTVALGGDGGDELFAGYDTFRGLAKAAAYDRVVPRPVHAGIRAMAGMLPVSHSNISFDFKIKRGLRGASYPPPCWNAVWLGALEPREIEELLGEPVPLEELYSEAIETWESCQQGNLVDRTLQFYTDIYLQDGILAKVDRASMMHSLEARSPFLDIEVANFARKLPHHFKLRDGTSKYLLKKAAEGLIPDDLIYRKKKGFGSPVGAWFRTGRLAPEARHPAAALKLRQHQSGKADERLFLWCHLVFEEWQKRNLGA